MDAINSVQFSNHTGYKCFKGQVLDAQNLDELFLGLKLNDLHKNYSHILTGYVNSKSFLLKIIDVVKEIKKANPNTIYGNELIYRTIKLIESTKFTLL